MADSDITKRDDTVSYMDVEEASRETLSVHWRAVFAGLFISLLVYFALVAFGIGIGAGQAIDVIRQQDDVSSLGIGAAIWLAATVLISLFVGSYASGRVSGIIATRVGYTQGAVISALFFTIMVSQIGMAFGMLGRGAGALAGAVGGSAKDIITNSRVVSVAEDALADLNFRIPSETVISGYLTRMLRGNEESANRYLAAQTGISQEQAGARYQQLRGQVVAVATEAGQDTARALRTMGWVAFATLLLGSLSAMFGGAIGAQRNIRKPVDEIDRRAFRLHQPAYSN